MTVDLQPAFALAADWVRDGVVPGVSIAVGRHGMLLGTFTAGKTSAGGGGPVDDATLYPLASVSKPFTAALAMLLVDRGVLTLDESLRRWVPALGVDKRDLTMRDALRHTAGLAANDPGEPALWAREASFDEIVASVASVPFADPVGVRVRYSNVGYWLAGAAAAAAFDLPFSMAIQRRIIEPFGLADEIVAAPDASQSSRIARRYGKNKIMNAPYGRALCPPTGGLFGTARGVVRFASIILDDGVNQAGTRLLSHGAVELMTTAQTGQLAGGVDNFAEWDIASWGLGFEVKGNKRAHWTGDYTSAATFSHFGQAGTLVWADPVTGIACAILANRDLYTNWIFKPARWARLNNAIVAAVMRNS